MTTTSKVDFKKLASYRAKHNTAQLLDLSEMQYLMIDGHGDPNSPAFEVALKALYPVAYKLKFFSKRELQRDYVVPPLEALWWADDMSSFTSARDKSQWHWTAMIMTPEWITPVMFSDVLASVGAKSSDRLEEVRLESLIEGRCVQALHIGSYDSEGPLLEEIHNEFIPSHGLQMTGRHHEIYLSDARKTAPENLRTILRQPVAIVDRARD